ncbi:MAG: hypothetical protein WBA57_18255 [Elainellaceae cyanobacterium]
MVLFPANGRSPIQHSTARAIAHPSQQGRSPFPYLQWIKSR